MGHCEDDEHIRIFPVFSSKNGTCPSRHKSKRHKQLLIVFKKRKKCFKDTETKQKLYVILMALIISQELKLFLDV